MRRPIRPIIGILIICLAASVAGLGSNVLRPDWLPLVRKRLSETHRTGNPASPKIANTAVKKPAKAADPPVQSPPAANVTPTNEPQPNAPPRPLPPPSSARKATPAPVSESMPEKKPESLFTGLQESKACFDAKSALFLDARPDEDYQAKHIVGALSLPFEEVDQVYAKVLRDVPKDKTIITYCSDPECGTATKLADYLAAKGYLHVYILLQGLPAWVDAGYPTVEGKEPGG